MLPSRAQETINNLKYNSDEMENVISRHNFDTTECSFSVLVTKDKIFYGRFSGDKSYLPVIELVFSQISTAQTLFSAREYDYFFRENTSKEWGVSHSVIEAIIAFLRPILSLHSRHWTQFDLHTKSLYYRSVMSELVTNLEGKSVVYISKNTIVHEGFSESEKTDFINAMKLLNETLELEFI